MKSLPILSLSALLLGATALVTPALAADNNNSGMGNSQTGMNTPAAASDLSSIPNNAHRFHSSKLRADNKSEDQTTRALNLEEAISSAAAQQTRGNPVGVSEARHDALEAGYIPQGSEFTQDGNVHVPASKDGQLYTVVVTPDEKVYAEPRGQHNQ
jgi:hypothetical protein